MNGDLQNRISPFASKTAVDFSDAAVKTAPKAIDSDEPKKVKFQDLIMNSNDDAARARAAQKNGDGLNASRTDAEFAKSMSEKLNKDNLRKPQNELDKDAFLKLFITQMQNQDPLNPDNSAEMASQLAQFHGLEQMMNVNKNLESMQSQAAVSRAVGLIDFVGKEIKLDNGKLHVEDGKVSEGVMTVMQEAAKATLEVRDSAGGIVATRELGILTRGERKVDWDGLDNEGKKVGAGTYTFNVVAKDMNEQDIPVRITSMVKVTGVDLKDEGGAFYTDLGKIRINEVASVGAAGSFGKTQKADDEKAKKPAAGTAAGDGAVEGVDGKPSVDAVAPAASGGSAGSSDDKPAPNAAAAAAPAAVAAQAEAVAGAPGGVATPPSAKPAASSSGEDRSVTRPPSGLGQAMEFPIATR